MLGRRWFSVASLWLLLLLPASAVLGEVVRFEINERAPFADGRRFGEVGTYERIVGRVHYAIDPALPQNQAIVDLQYAPRNKDGQVEFFGDLLILAPKVPSNGNGAILYDVNNRGNLLSLAMFNFASRTNLPQTKEHAGDGFLMRQGFTLVWSGWDGELLPGGEKLRLSVPIARDGRKPITGPVRCEIVPTKDMTRSVVNWANHGSYRPTNRGLQTATLTHRERAADPREPISREQWTLHVTDIESDSPTQLPQVELELRTGMKKGHIYELIYEGQDPMVHGVCFASVRDLISAFKYGGGRDNPLLADGKPVIQRAHGFGVSQSGRFLREFLYADFNADEQGRQVFDGLIPHVAGGGLGSFNHRFAQPTRHTSQHDHHEYPADRFPFTYGSQTDPLSGQTGGILAKSTASNTAPLVMHTQSSAEYWTRSGSLAHTDPLGKRDAPAPDNVRFYTFGGTQHGPASFPPPRGDARHPANPGDYRPLLRAALVALDRWAKTGEAAPPSIYPTISDGTLVAWDRESTGFPHLPGVAYPQVIQQPSWWDLGLRWESQQIIDKQPPTSRGDYQVRVPASGEDGNDRGCLLPPEVAVPLATYTGWNVRRAEAGGGGELVSLWGAYLPLPVTQAQRKKSGDPRQSLEGRYGTLEEYMRQFKAECERLTQAGYLLEEDARRAIQIHRERAKTVFEKLPATSKASPE